MERLVVAMHTASLFRAGGQVISTKQLGRGPLPQQANRLGNGLGHKKMAPRKP